MSRITCNNAEALFAEYLEGTVNNTDRLAMDAHLATCADCGAMAEDMRLALRFTHAAVDVEPPAELITRILAATTGQTPVGVSAWRYRMRGAWDSFILRVVRPIARPVLDPRFAMGAAMTVISCSMLLSLAGVDVRQVKMRDLQPANLYNAAERGVHTAGSRATKYYNNLRVVYEIQSQLEALRDDRDNNAADAPAAPAKDPAKDSDKKKEAPKKDGSSNSQRFTRPLTLAASTVFSLRAGGL